MIELLRFKKRVSQKKRRTYYDAHLGTAHLLLFRNFDKQSGEDHDLVLYAVPMKMKKKAENGDD